MKFHAAVAADCHRYCVKSMGDIPGCQVPPNPSGVGDQAALAREFLFRSSSTIAIDFKKAASKAAFFVSRNSTLVVTGCDFRPRVPLLDRSARPALLSIRPAAAALL
jgi:hypothetical protein